MYNYFQGTKSSPYHISIGAVVRNSEGNICCHYFEKITHESIGTLENFYLLMRETIEPDETIEQTLKRGLEEEFGMKARLKSYIGSIVSHFLIQDSGVLVEKTTLYFLCEYISLDISKRKKGDLESTSELVWVEPSKLILQMKEQGKRLRREDIDESIVLEKII